MKMGKRIGRVCGGRRGGKWMVLPGSGATSFGAAFSGALRST